MVCFPFILLKVILCANKFDSLSLINSSIVNVHVPETLIEKTNYKIILYILQHLLM